MNPRQKIVILSGLIFMILTGLFPPWKYTLNHEGTNIETVGQYGCIANPPPPPERDLWVPEQKLWGTHLDISRLLVEWAMIGVFTVGLILILNNSRQK